ncbi:phage shock protein operon transcriptional activator [Sphingomonas sp. 10B4]|jgi:psp operon transcriptional activator|uniref:phage shock protein operon transcriptional activator n=1 Tax=Sphingomonas sp. 10B4 TaxID=3048575 RepID=UPI002AB42C28|nr:phage shock protein operon transcriptional activator [Sphingomonas sp. 10B4]MDY7522526.1 phage shock protein operon transcriptional activator [Sphingomonas sp. 10B4]MEB0282334.1 phage shock protein operon transcriptional activator [Sphingomonas sp. 10B4]
MERTTQVIGQSGAFLDALELASRAAALDRPVLVIGERGTGKELVAERLHRLSPRWDQPLVIMNCAALPETLIEAELFGHEAGAFTGATKARAGRFEEAHRGTLFLDELGTLSMAAQDRLLRAVEYGEVTRIGSSRPMRVDVRIVAATNEHLPDKVARHQFRADLLDRLSFEVVTLPPMRARVDDILVLAEHFGRRMASELGRDHWPGFTKPAEAALVAYQWPGNVRELRNVVERAVYRWDLDGPIDAIQFDPFHSPHRPATMVSLAEPSAVAPAAPPVAAPPSAAAAEPMDYKARLARFECEMLQTAMAENRFNQRATAEALGLSYDQLRHALKRHGLISGAATESVA